MHLSIIIPTRNREKLLTQCLESLVKQTYDKKKYEIIVVDNNSTDCTKRVVESYKSKFPEIGIHYVLESRLGLVFARHAGAKKASYEFLVYGDDDGLYSNNWLQEIAKIYALNEKVCAVGTKIVIKWDAQPPDWVLPYEPLLGKLDYQTEGILPQGSYINGGSFSIKKSVLYELKGFNPDQIDDWLIGDGESGLCTKIHNTNYLIGWTSNAYMEHCQFIQRNATVKDIRRRFANNGIGLPYRVFAVDKKGLIVLVPVFFSALFNSLLWWGRYQYYLLRRKERNRIFDAIFNYAFFQGQIPYILRIFFVKRFRKYLLLTDWF